MKQYACLFFYIALLYGFLGLSACTEEVKPISFTYSQLLTGKESKTWKLRSIEITDNGKTQSYPLSENDCDGDDSYVFFANAEKTYEVHSGKNKCAEDEQDVYYQSSWGLINATATLNIALPLLTGDTSINFVIKKLTEDKMVLEYYFEDGSSYGFSFISQK